MPELLNSLAAMFAVGSGCPTGPETYEKAMGMLLTSLPDRPRAWSLCETFLEQACWLFRPLKRDELIEEIFTPVYIAKEEHENPQPNHKAKVSPHKISSIYSIFAMGGMVDLTLPAFNQEGEHYHQCARAALALQSIFDSPVIETVQALLFMTYYCSNASQRYRRDSVWLLISLASKVAQSVRLFGVLALLEY